jgi:DNA-binding response OmpR family regulator
MGNSILVVEDDRDSRMALCAMLEGLGFAPSAFASAREALEGVKDKSFDLALLDVMMPEMNGYELLQALKELSNFSSVPIIMVTARDDDSDVLEGYQYGADYYITKPYTLEQLRFGLKLYLP